MNIKKLTCLILCFTLACGALISCNISQQDKTNEPQTQSKSYYEFFDTVSVIFSYEGDDSTVFEQRHTAVSSLLQKYHRLFDIYYEYAGINNLKTVNLKAGIEPVKVDRELIDFLLYCKEIYTLTNGKTNIAMGSVLKLWHDARELSTDSPDRAYIPSEQELYDASLHTDIESIVIDEENSTVYISDPQTSIDVGAVGKGYATEKAAELLLEMGVKSYVLNIGGNIRAIGQKMSGNGWITGITNPDKTSEDSFVCRVVIKDISLVTSGDYERYFMFDGKKYHHIIDPSTNMPAEHFSSVSVFVKDSGLADALSTALFCMSYEQGLEIINSLDGADAIWVYRDGTVKATNGITFSNNKT